MEDAKETKISLRYRNLVLPNSLLNRTYFVLDTLLWQIIPLRGFYTGEISETPAIFSSTPLEVILGNSITLIAKGHTLAPLLPLARACWLR